MPSGRTVTTLCTAALAIGIAACGGNASGVPDGPEERRAAGGALARLVMAGGSHERALDEGAEFAEGATVAALERQLERSLSAAERERVREILRRVLAEFIPAEAWEEILSETGAEHFTASELRSIAAFLESPAGAKFVELQGAMSREIDARIDAMFEGRREDFGDRVDEELAREFDGLAGEDPS